MQKKSILSMFLLENSGFPNITRLVVERNRVSPPPPCKWKSNRHKMYYIYIAAYAMKDHIDHRNLKDRNIDVYPDTLII